MILRTRDLFVRQRTQSINARRAHLAEHGLIVPQGLSNLAGIQRLVEERATGLEPLVAETARIYLEPNGEDGARDIRRRLIIRAKSVIRWATRKETIQGTWLHAMLLRKPRKVVAIALANKMARALWAMETRKELSGSATGSSLTVSDSQEWDVGVRGGHRQ